MRKRWEREARVTGTIEHPHIVRLIEAGEIDGKWYLASEYVPGINLAKWLTLQKPKAVAPKELAWFLAQVTGAIAQAHRQGVIHRDLKPGNILLKGDFQLSIGSLAHAYQRWRTLDWPSGWKIAAGNPVRCTAWHTAVHGSRTAELRHGDISPATDIYALGLLLFELVTQQPLLSSVPMLPMIQQIIQKEAPRLRTIRPDCPVDLETICAKCLEKEPRQRYASAQSLHDNCYVSSTASPLWRVPWIGGASQSMD